MEQSPAQRVKASESINIPKRQARQVPNSTTGHANHSQRYNSSPASSMGSSSTASTPASSSYNSAALGTDNREEGQTPTTADKGKAPARDKKPSIWGHERRPSLMGSSFSHTEHTVVDVGSPHGPPRLITCVRSSQGFDWNQEIFLPSYASDHDYMADLQHRQDPVEEIFVTEEEEERMFPR